MNMKILLAAMLICAPVMCAAQSAPAETAPEAHAKAIAPFIDEGTLIVIRLDLRKMNVEALSEQLQGWSRHLEPDPQAGREQVDALQRMTKIGKAFQQEMLRAGAQEMYILASLADFPLGDFFTVVPLPSGANAERIQDLLYDPPGGRPTSRPSTRPAKTQPADREDADIHPPLTANAVSQMRGAVVASRKEVIERLKKTEPMPRLDLAQAFAVGDDAELQILVIPSPSTRFVLQAMMPELPSALGGSQTAAFTQGYEWGTLAIHLPPATSAQAVIQLSSDQACETFRTVLTKALRAIGKETIVKRVVPDYEKGVETLIPGAKGNRLVLTLDKQQVDRVVRQTVGPSALLAYRIFRRHEDSNIYALWRAIDEYHDKHKAWPDDLQVLVKEGLVQPETLQSPVPGKREYIYLKPTQSSRNPGDKHILLYEPYKEWREGIEVMYANSQSDTIEDEAKFLELLARTRQENTEMSTTSAPATRQATLNRIVALIRALHIYHGIHARWPDSLQTLPNETGLPPDNLINPTRPYMNPAFVYIKPTIPDNKIDGASQMVIYEAYDQWGEGIGVGFADGHAVFISDKAQFEKLLAKTKQENTGTPTTSAPATGPAKAP